MGEHLTIKRRTEQEDFFARLCEKALKDIQKSAGKIWTDYNYHDPGVTLLDAMNYALWEADFRFYFPWQDYLVSLEKEHFNPAEHALFVPSQIFPVNPVTATDYQKLFLSTVDDLIGVKIEIDKSFGKYNFILNVRPDITEIRKKEIIQEVRILFHTHRNLCENIGDICFYEYERLHLCGQIEIDEEADANQIMANIYWEAQEFLSAGVRFRRIEELLAEGKTIEELLDGPVQRRMSIDDASLSEEQEEYDIAELYRKIKELPGTIRIISLAFRQKEVETHTLQKKTPIQVFAVYSYGETEQTMTLTKKGEKIQVSPEAVSRILYSKQVTCYGEQNKATDKSLLDVCSDGTYHHIFTHEPIAHDLPECYQRKMNESLKEYLVLFDEFMLSLWEELKALPSWMCTNPSFLSEKKEAWMDMLDYMYGEDSNPAFLRRYESEDERRIRRIKFLSHIPMWGRDRGRAMNVLDCSTKVGIAEYLHYLIGFEKYGMEIFMLEHRFLNRDIKDECFSVSVVWAIKKEWLDMDEFRASCEQLLMERIPAHIKIHIFWKDKEGLDDFISDYRSWRYALSVDDEERRRELGDIIKNKL